MEVEDIWESIYSQLTSIHTPEQSSASIISQIERLLELNGDINSFDTNGQSILSQACLMSNYDVLHFLLTQKKQIIDIEQRDPVFHRTPIHYLVTATPVTSETYRCFKLFLTYKPFLESVDCFGVNPLGNLLLSTQQFNPFHVKMVKKLVKNSSLSPLFNVKLSRNIFLKTHWSSIVGDDAGTRPYAIPAYLTERSTGYLFSQYPIDSYYKAIIPSSIQRETSMLIDNVTPFFFLFQNESQHDYTSYLHILQLLMKYYDITMRFTLSFRNLFYPPLMLLFQQQYPSVEVIEYLLYPSESCRYVDGYSTHFTRPEPHQKPIAVADICSALPHKFHPSIQLLIYADVNNTPELFTIFYLVTATIGKPQQVESIAYNRDHGYSEEELAIFRELRAKDRHEAKVQRRSTLGRSRSLSLLSQNASNYAAAAVAAANNGAGGEGGINNDPAARLSQHTHLAILDFLYSNHLRYIEIRLAKDVLKYCLIRNPYLHSKDISLQFQLILSLILPEAKILHSNPLMYLFRNVYKQFSTELFQYFIQINPRWIYDTYILVREPTTLTRPLISPLHWCFQYIYHPDHLILLEPLLSVLPFYIESTATLSGIRSSLEPIENKEDEPAHDEGGDGDGTADDDNDTENENGNDGDDDDADEAEGTRSRAVASKKKTPASPGGSRGRAKTIAAAVSLVGVYPRQPNLVFALLTNFALPLTLFKYLLSLLLANGMSMERLLADGLLFLTTPSIHMNSTFVDYDNCIYLFDFIFNTTVTPSTTAPATVKSPTTPDSLMKILLSFQHPLRSFFRNINLSQGNQSAIILLQLFLTHHFNIFSFASYDYQRECIPSEYNRYIQTLRDHVIDLDAFPPIVYHGSLPEPKPLSPGVDLLPVYTPEFMRQFKNGSDAKTTPPQHTTQPGDGGLEPGGADIHPSSYVKGTASARAAGGAGSDGGDPDRLSAAPVIMMPGKPAATGTPNTAAPSQERATVQGLTLDPPSPGSAPRDSTAAADGQPSTPATTLRQTYSGIGPRDSFNGVDLRSTISGGAVQRQRRKSIANSPLTQQHQSGRMHDDDDEEHDENDVYPEHDGDYLSPLGQHRQLTGGAATAADTEGGASPNSATRSIAPSSSTSSISLVYSHAKTTRMARDTSFRTSTSIHDDLLRGSSIIATSLSASPLQTTRTTGERLSIASDDFSNQSSSVNDEDEHGRLLIHIPLRTLRLIDLCRASQNDFIMNRFGNVYSDDGSFRVSQYIKSKYYTTYKLTRDILDKDIRCFIASPSPTGDESATAAAAAASPMASGGDQQDTDMIIHSTSTVTAASAPSSVSPPVGGKLDDDLRHLEWMISDSAKFPLKAIYSNIITTFNAIFPHLTHLPRSKLSSASSGHLHQPYHSTHATVTNPSSNASFPAGRQPTTPSPLQHGRSLSYSSKQQHSDSSSGDLPTTHLYLDPCYRYETTPVGQLSPFSQAMCDLLDQRRARFSGYDKSRLTKTESDQIREFFGELFQNPTFKCGPFLSHFFAHIFPTMNIEAYLLYSRFKYTVNMLLDLILLPVNQSFRPIQNEVLAGFLEYLSQVLLHPIDGKISPSSSNTNDFILKLAQFDRNNGYALTLTDAQPRISKRAAKSSDTASTTATDGNGSNPSDPKKPLKPSKFQQQQQQQQHSASGQQPALTLSSSSSGASGGSSTGTGVANGPSDTSDSISPESNRRHLSGPGAGGPVAGGMVKSAAYDDSISVSGDRAGIDASTTHNSQFSSYSTYNSSTTTNATHHNHFSGIQPDVDIIIPPLQGVQSQRSGASRMGGDGVRRGSGSTLVTMGLGTPQFGASATTTSSGGSHTTGGLPVIGTTGTGGGDSTPSQASRSARYGHGHVRSLSHQHHRDDLALIIANSSILQDESTTSSAFGRGEHGSVMMPPISLLDSSRQQHSSVHGQRGGAVVGGGAAAAAHVDQSTTNAGFFKYGHNTPLTSSIKPHTATTMDNLILPSVDDGNASMLRTSSSGMAINLLAERPPPLVVGSHSFHPQPIPSVISSLASLAQCTPLHPQSSLSSHRDTPGPPISRRKAFYTFHYGDIQFTVTTLLATPIPYDDSTLTTLRILSSSLHLLFFVDDRIIYYESEFDGSMNNYLCNVLAYSQFQPLTPLYTNVISAISIFWNYRLKVYLKYRKSDEDIPSITMHCLREAHQRDNEVDAKIIQEDLDHRIKYRAEDADYIKTVHLNVVTHHLHVLFSYCRHVNDHLTWLTKFIMNLPFFQLNSKVNGIKTYRFSHYLKQEEYSNYCRKYGNNMIETQVNTTGKSMPTTIESDTGVVTTMLGGVTKAGGGGNAVMIHNPNVNYLTPIIDELSRADDFVTSLEVFFRNTRYGHTRTHLDILQAYLCFNSSFAFYRTQYNETIFSALLCHTMPLNQYTVDCLKASLTPRHYHSFNRSDLDPSDTYDEQHRCMYLSQYVIIYQLLRIRAHGYSQVLWDVLNTLLPITADAAAVMDLFSTQRNLSTTIPLLLQSILLGSPHLPSIPINPLHGNAFLNRLLAWGLSDEFHLSQTLRRGASSASLSASAPAWSGSATSVSASAVLMSVLKLRYNYNLNDRHENARELKQLMILACSPFFKVRGLKLTQAFHCNNPNILKMMHICHSEHAYHDLIRLFASYASFKSSPCANIYGSVMDAIIHNLNPDVFQGIFTSLESHEDIPPVVRFWLIVIGYHRLVEHSIEVEQREQGQGHLGDESGVQAQPDSIAFTDVGATEECSGKVDGADRDAKPSASKSDTDDTSTTKSHGDKAIDVEKDAGDAPATTSDADTEIDTALSSSNISNHTKTPTPTPSKTSTQHNSTHDTSEHQHTLKDINNGNNSTIVFPSLPDDARDMILYRYHAQQQSLALRSTHLEPYPDTLRSVFLQPLELQATITRPPIPFHVIGKWLRDFSGAETFHNRTPRGYSGNGTTGILWYIFCYVSKPSPDDLMAMLTHAKGITVDTVNADKQSLCMMGLLKQIDEVVIIKLIDMIGIANVLNHQDQHGRTILHYLLALSENPICENYGEQVLQHLISSATDAGIDIMAQMETILDTVFAEYRTLVIKSADKEYSVSSIADKRKNMPIDESLAGKQKKPGFFARLFGCGSDKGLS